MNTFTFKAGIYVATFVTALIFHHNELLLFFLHAALLGTIIYMHMKHTKSPEHCVAQAIQAPIIAGISLTIASWICAVKFSMWKHSNAVYGIPLWMPFTWMIVAFFVIDINNLEHVKIHM